MMDAVTVSVIGVAIALAALFVSCSMAYYHWKVDRGAKLVSTTIERLDKLYNKNDSYRKAFLTQSISHMDDVFLDDLLFDIELLSALGNRNRIDVNLFVDITGNDIPVLFSQLSDRIVDSRARYLYNSYLYCEFERFQHLVAKILSRRR